MFSPPYSDLYTGLIFGEQGTSIPYEYKQLFKRTGLLHALVVSGSQVSLLIGVMIYFSQWMGLRRVIRLIVLVFVCVFFYFLTGGGVSILRSVMMNSLVLIMTLGFRHQTSTLHVMCFVGMVMIIASPLCVFDMGAVLSFCATFSLIYGKPKLQAAFPLKWPQFLRECLSICIAPWLFTMPVLLYFFHHLSWISLMSNLILVGVIEGVVMIGFFSTLIGFAFPLVSTIGHDAAWGCMQLIVWVSRCFDQVLGGTLYVPSLSLIHLLWMVSGVVMCCHLAELRRYKGWVWSYVAIGILLWWSVFHTENVRVTFLDVGQGDCTLIEAQGQVLLIDGGPIFDTSSYKDNAQRIVDVLQYKGINHVDVMIITHFDLDHYGGLLGVMQQIPVGIVYDNGQGQDLVLYQTSLEESGTMRGVLSPGDRLEMGSVVMDVLHSADPLFESKNNDSLVVKMTINDVTFLFAGDIESDVEQVLVQRYSEVLDVDWLKVAHHGSRTSSTWTFLQAVSPRVSVVSAGRRNAYGHPHPDVIDRLSQWGDVRRLDLEGAVEVVLD